MIGMNTIKISLVLSLHINRGSVYLTEALSRKKYYLEIRMKHRNQSRRNHICDSKCSPKNDNLQL